MRLLIISSGILTMLVTAVPAFAQNSFEPGLYAGVNGGLATVSSNKYVDDSNDLAFGYTVGYQFTRNFGFEAYYRKLSFDPFRGFLGEAGYYPSSHYGASVLTSAYMGNKFSLYGRAGLGSTTLDGNRRDLTSKHEIDPSVGVGLNFAFTPHWSMNLEDMYLTKSKVNLISVGVRHKF